MKVNRENLLGILTSVEPGVASLNGEVMEQSSCLVFAGGKVWSYNDEVCCSRKCDVGIDEGAVRAKPLLDLLSKLKEETIDIDRDDSQVLVKGKGRKSGVRFEKDILLPIEAVDAPGEWRRLDKAFSDAIQLVAPCASVDENQWVLTCVHVAEGFVESCDRFQIARYEVDTGVDQDILVRADAIKCIRNQNMIDVSETEAWIHFRNDDGLVMSIRRYTQEYQPLDSFLDDEETTSLVIPGAIDAITEKAGIFSSNDLEGNFIFLAIKSNRIRFRGEGVDGWYEERMKIDYDSDVEIKFKISPSLLSKIAGDKKACKIGEGRVLVESGPFKYSTFVWK